MFGKLWGCCLSFFEMAAPLVGECLAMREGPTEQVKNWPSSRCSLWTLLGSRLPFFLLTSCSWQCICSWASWTTDLTRWRGSFVSFLLWSGHGISSCSGDGGGCQHASLFSECQASIKRELSGGGVTDSSIAHLKSCRTYHMRIAWYDYDWIWLMLRYFMIFDTFTWMFIKSRGLKASTSRVTRGGDWCDCMAFSQSLRRNKKAIRFDNDRSTVGEIIGQSWNLMNFGKLLIEKPSQVTMKPWSQPHSLLFGMVSSFKMLEVGNVFFGKR